MIREKKKGKQRMAMYDAVVMGELLIDFAYMGSTEMVIRSCMPIRAARRGILSAYLPDMG